MKNPNFEPKPQAETLPTDSVDRLRLINDTNRMLEGLSDFGLETEEGRLGLKVALDLVFSNIDQIEGDKYEVTNESLIRARIRDLYIQLYDMGLPDSAGEDFKKEFYPEIGEMLEIIEQRGLRFIEDMDEYKIWNQERDAA